ncbi:MAG: hypothetical protein R3E10_15395 [Gemmatimonadota bacterium]
MEAPAHLAAFPGKGVAALLSRLPIGVAAALALAPSFLCAQGTPSVLELTHSARSAALGGAYPLADPLADVLFAAPGRIGDARGLSLFHADFGANGRGFTAAGAADWWGGGVAGGVQVLSYGVASEDPDALPPRESRLGDDGPVPVSEAVLSAGFGREVFDVDVGAALKLVEMRLGAVRASTVGVDVGAAHALGPVSVALSLQNLGGDLSFPGGSRSLPTKVALGLGTQRRPLGPLDLGAAGAVTRLVDGEVEAGAGVELSYWPINGRTFSGRAGYRHAVDEDLRGLTLGGGFAGDQIRIDYAWQSAGDGRGHHRFGLSWRP